MDETECIRDSTQPKQGGWEWIFLIRQKREGQEKAISRNKGKIYIWDILGTAEILFDWTNHLLSTKFNHMILTCHRWSKTGVALQLFNYIRHHSLALLARTERICNLTTSENCMLFIFYLKDNDLTLYLSNWLLSSLVQPALLLWIKTGLVCTLAYLLSGHFFSYSPHPTINPISPRASI